MSLHPAFNRIAAALSWLNAIDIPEGEFHNPAYGPQERADVQSIIARVKEKMDGSHGSKENLWTPARAEFIESVLRESGLLLPEAEPTVDAVSLEVGIPLRFKNPWPPVEPVDEKFYDIELKDGTIARNVEFWGFGGGFGLNVVPGRWLVQYPLEDVISFAQAEMKPGERAAHSGE